LTVVCFAFADMAWAGTFSLLQHMMETLRQQQGPGGTSSALSGLSGGLTGVAVGLMASFLLGAGSLGGQVNSRNCLCT
jgi:hypothetical protein